jgi:hypothetical protein
MSEKPIPHLGAQFTDHVGRHYMEFPMPKDMAYEHPLHSYGEPRRLQVIDPNETRRFSIDQGYIRPNERGTQGLIGYTDFYREPPTQKGFMHKITHEDGSVTREDHRRIAADSNVGFMNVHDDHMKKGIAREMVNHLDRTTDPNSKINMGKAMHEATMYIADDLNESKPDRVTYKTMFFKPRMKLKGVEGEQ